MRTRLRRLSGSTLAAIVGALLLAAALRFWRIGVGLDHGVVHPDEFRWFLRSAAFVPLSCSSFDLSPTLFFYPTLFGYAAGLATAVAHATGIIVGDPVTAVPQIILIARSVAAGFGVLAVAIVGLAAWRMYSPAAALIAMAFVALDPVALIQLHAYASVDVLLVCCFALTVLAAYRLAVQGTTRAALIAGALVGLSFATKYPGLASLVPVGLGVVETYRRERDVRRAAVLFGSVLLGLVAAVVVACPPCVMRSDAMLAGIARSGRALGEQHIFAIDPTLGWYARPYLYQAFASLPFSFGWPLYLIVLYGVVVAIRRHTLADRIVLAAILPYLVVFGGAGAWMPRYILPVLSWMTVLGARGLADLRLRHRRAADLLLVAVWTYSLVFASSLLAAETSLQQAEVAAWIADHPPPRAAAGDQPIRVGFPFETGAYVALGTHLQHAGLVPVAGGKTNWIASRPDVFVLPAWDEVWIARGPASPAQASLRRLRSGEAGYREVARWTPWYLQRSFYTWLDPAFGTKGFTVFVRDDASARPGRTTGAGGGT